MFMLRFVQRADISLLQEERMRRRNRHPFFFLAGQVTRKQTRLSTIFTHTHAHNPLIRKIHSIEKK